jgi:hypothetical protein
VARGTFRRVHLIFGDIIGSTTLACLFRIHWHVVHTHVSMSIPSEIQWLYLSQIYGADIFGVSGIGVRATTHLELPFAEIPKLLSTLPLDPMVKFLSYDLRCRSFLELRVFAISRLRKQGSSLLVSWVPKRCLTTMFPLKWTVLTNSGFCVSRFPHSCATLKVFKPCACSPDLTVVRVLLSSRTDPTASTLLVWSSLSPCGHIPHRLQFHNTATPPELGNMVK